MSKHRGKGVKAKVRDQDTPEKKVHDGLEKGVDTTEFETEFSMAQKEQHNFKEFFN